MALFRHIFKRNFSSAIKDFEATQTLQYLNGAKVKPLFSGQEYERRLSQLRQKMEQEKMEVAIFTSMHNIAYFSNFVYCSFGRPYALVVTPEKNITVSALVDGG